MKFCGQCGASVRLVIPAGDNRQRYVCVDCEFIHYQNPNVVVGTVPLYLDGDEPKILLCKRGIEPRLGYWTLPAGFLENDETTQQGAWRETQEEACADVTSLELYRVINVPRTNQIHMFFRATLEKPDFQTTEESTEVELYTFDAIPWRQLAFPTVYRTLKDFISDYNHGEFATRLCDVGKQDWQELDF